MSAAKAWPRHFKAYKFMSGSCKKQKLYCCCMQSARQDLIHMAASRKKHRGEATCEEQARPNNDDEPSNHVGLCYDTVMEKHCWLSLHIMQVCVVTVLWKKNLCPIVPPTSANLLDPPGAAASKKKSLIRVRHLASRWPNALHLLGCRPVRPRPRHPCTHQVLKRFVHLTWAIAAHCIEAFLPLPSCPKFVWGLHALP